ncbi:extracellular solute-binding protein [Paenibacillus sp. RC67]|uniref:extracellular solute-binding protein n=1 Tax=Paenibacillus sp. RC67 TaxID=3039392 RepID=UPI0024AE6042|nr:extracellular solute-binding protein [Paenibacillus sp. RC67]
MSHKHQSVKKVVGVGLAISLAGGLVLAGCSKSPTDSGNGSGGKDPAKGQAGLGSTYPLQTTEGLTSWESLNNNATTFAPNLTDLPFGKQLEKETGVKVKYIHPSDNQTKEQFNLMIASNELPDTVEYDWTGRSAGSYPGGPEKAIADKVIVPLNDIIDKYAPNLKKKLQADKELDKMIKTDSGKYYVFPMIRNPSGLVFRGPIIRKDWLDDLGLQMPTTVDEWETVLKAFKEKKGATAPLSVTYVNGNLEMRDAFIGAYKTSNTFYLDDQGKVKFGPIDPQYKDALALLRKWYAEGLFDKDFALTDGKALDTKMLSGQTGATVGLQSGGLGKWLDTMKGKDPKYNLVAAPYPSLKKGETPFTGHRDFKYSPGASKAITTGAKNPELVAKWLDYAYSEKGGLLFNFGIEGDSYTMDKGIPKYTDKIVKNDKYNLQQMIAQYTKPNGPYEADERRSWNSYKQQDDAPAIWGATDAEKHTIPLFLTPTIEESKELGKIINDVTNYKEEMFVKFVVGKEPLDNYDTYVAQIKKLGIERAVKIYQDALDRYNKR